MGSSSAIPSCSPCAACKFLRRKCIPGCIFAPYFPPEEPQKFASVHKVFGASNVTKLLNDIEPGQREDAVNSLAYEAEARIKDPVYGCVGAISLLQRQVQRLQKDLESTRSELLRYSCGGERFPAAGAAGVPAFGSASRFHYPPPPPPPLAHGLLSSFSNYYFPQSWNASTSYSSSGECNQREEGEGSL
ncbi:Protein LATERAL ORGAN BOUNDARIES [Platanthera zijinensis]|uniref:Protein LATERAL ORGAN BOUNDARIES n=1 Tax=Platanthera zijinensis TaxID=2320716 RepID=A0AAP0BGN4_9ASPA